MNKPRHNKNQNQTLGAFGEDLAQKAVLERGWHLVARNWRYSRLGELDLIAYDATRECLHIIEVKTRHSSQSQTTGRAIEAVTPAKQAKIRQLAELFLAEQHTDLAENGPYSGISERGPITDLSLDVITVECDARQHWHVELVENAF